MEEKEKSKESIFGEWLDLLAFDEFYRNFVLILKMLKMTTGRSEEGFSRPTFRCHLHSMTVAVFDYRSIPHPKWYYSISCSSHSPMVIDQMFPHRKSSNQKHQKNASNLEIAMNCAFQKSIDWNCPVHPMDNRTCNNHRRVSLDNDRWVLRCLLHVFA